MRPRSRLAVEQLEDRLTPNNRFVVPVGGPVDNVSHFATLAAALITPGLATGDAIQIEPGSTPGNVTSATFTIAFTTATVLTIRGSSAATAATLPAFTVSDATAIAANRTLLLTNAHLSLIGAGSVRWSGNTTVADSLLVDTNSTAVIPFAFSGVTSNLTGCTVVNNAAGVNALFNITTNAAGSGHTISGNTFVSNVNTNSLLGWFNGVGVPVTDVASDNRFVTQPGATTGLVVTVGEAVSGSVFRNNHVTGPVSYGLSVSNTPTNLRILGNRFDLTGPNAVGISMGGGAGSSATIADNVTRTNETGTGLQVFVSAGMLLKVQGNDFHANRVGVELDSGALSLAGIDFGGGTQSSLGGNNFRGFTAAATSTAAAMVTDSTTGAVQAQRNLFGVSNPQAVIFRSGAGTVTTTGQLTGNAAFVQTLYTQFLRRTGDTTSASDAGGWLNAMNGGTSQATVANGIIRSAEALGYVVDDLYRTILKRAADPAGRQNFVNLLSNGGTIEAVQSVLYGSAEYRFRHPGDAAFVTSLYWSVLGRSPDNVAYWVNQIPSLGRTGVAAGFIQSTEYRTTLVKNLYSDLLKRTTAPTPAEVAGWVNTGLDLLTLRVSFASTLEFFLNG